MFHQLLSICCLFSIGFSALIQSEKTVRVDAAFTYRNILFLFSGNEFIALFDHTQGEQPHPRSYFELQDEFDLLGAYADEENDMVHFYGPNYIATASFKDIDNGKGIVLQEDVEYPFPNGPDAVLTRYNSIFFHKGCDVYTKAIDGDFNPKPFGVPDLPCDIDAAWVEGNGDLVILKGDKIWVTTAGGEFRPALDFHSVYNVWSWKLRSAC